MKHEKTPFKAPKSQELVAFRKNIEKNELDTVRNIIQLNPRYLVSSGDMPTILKEGPRYNALHVAAIEGNAAMCKLILQTIDNSAFIENLHGQRTPSTDEVSAILLDLYLNMPDKCRSETPLHFASKFGSVGVVEVLISYPQCKVTQNSDGHLPQDVICSRAKDKNDTPEIRRAIRDLLLGRFFVPVLRAVDNSTPPQVGEPFTLSHPPNLEAKDKFSSKLEIKAYAGPMDKEKAEVFCKRWKTPPRLIASPKFISPVKALSSSKIPVSIGGGGGGGGGIFSPLSSTPIGKKAGRRSLFPNRSFELEREEQERDNSINNNFEIEAVKEDVDQEAIEELRQEDDKNGNNLGGIKPLRGLGGSLGLRMSPVKKTHDKFLYRKYREQLQSSFATIYDDDDDEIDARSDINGLEKSVGNADANYSYFCDENNSIYEGANVIDSPSFKERKLRLTDTEKGLEIIGRNLAENHEVGWSEYWKFLGTFTDLKSNDGLGQFENYLLKRQQRMEIAEQEALLKATLDPMTLAGKQKNYAEPKSNDSLGSICAAMGKMTLAESLKFSPHPRKLPEPIRSKITNPYLCLHNSLQVFAMRFVKNLNESSTSMTMDFAAFFQQAVVDCVRKLNGMVDNYRKDAAFGSIDFSKVHSRYAQLIVINIELQEEKAQGVIHRLKVLLDKSREVNSARKYPDLHDSLICLQNFLDFYIHKKSELMKDDQGDALHVQTEANCSRIWREDPLVHCCNCRIDGMYAKKGSMERLNKRREQRQKAASVQQQESVAEINKHTISSLASHDNNTHGLYRNSAEAGEQSDDEDEEYFSCSDSDPDTDSDGDDPNVSYETPPSSPSFLSRWQEKIDVSSVSQNELAEVSDDSFLDSKDDLDECADDDVSDEKQIREYQNFIEGPIPSKQDLDVLNVIEKRAIDQTQFPHVFAWRQAMLKLSLDDRECLTVKMARPRYRVMGAFGTYNDSSTTADLESIPSISDSRIEGVQVRGMASISKLCSFVRGNGATDGRQDSLEPLDDSLASRLNLMNISDYNSNLQQRVAPAPSS